MIDQSDTLLYKLRFLFVGLLLVASLFLLSVLISGIEVSSAQATDSETTANSFAIEMSEDPNVIAGGMVVLADEAVRAVGTASDTVIRSAQATASAVADGGRMVGRGAKTGVTTTARGVGAGLGFVGHTVGSGVSFVVGVPGDVVGFVGRTAVVRAVIRPSDHADVPIIDPNSPELRAALVALPPTATVGAAAPQHNAGPVWPIHGHITTHFGVSHWPYQPVHTGIDISDGRPSGVTPIKPFRPGRVIETVYSRQGLGNHVVVDHGSGVTSVYAHLHSIAVRVGQEVNLDTILGTEGTTGLSTGTHLHFEIRVNGQAADPRQFIAGRP